jgi:hypothetical protein
MGRWTSVFMIGITTYLKDYILLPLRLITVSNVTTIINLFPNQPNINLHIRSRTLHLFHKQ